MDKKEIRLLIIILIILVISVLLFVNVIKNKNNSGTKDKIDIYIEDVEKEPKEEEIINNVYRKGGKSLKDGDMKLFNPVIVE
ncbi:MAG: hypothetical protein PHR25_05790 [Clostridia bacterium]|nr:hypothetical protein [Clostridia bacterium]MDD4376277.1 hypothetical protein [Clostridia bacterium]